MLQFSLQVRAGLKDQVLELALEQQFSSTSSPVATPFINTILLKQTTPKPKQPLHISKAVFLLTLRPILVFSRVCFPHQTIRLLLYKMTNIQLHANKALDLPQALRPQGRLPGPRNVTCP